jgi:hypothetical protein
MPYKSLYFNESPTDIALGDHAAAAASSYRGRIAVTHADDVTFNVTIGDGVRGIIAGVRCVAFPPHPPHWSAKTPLSKS